MNKPARKKNKPAATQGSLPKNTKYINRELSWLAFNDRVLEEARDTGKPLLERVKFLAITCSNLDEFFMIRVASLRKQVFADYQVADPAGLKPSRQLAAIAERAHVFAARQYSTFSRSLLPALARNGIRILPVNRLSRDQKVFLRDYFTSVVFPILTPMAVDASRPFPLLANRSLNLCVRIDPGQAAAGQEPGMAIVQVPAVIPRLISLPAGEGLSFILLEDLIRLFIGHLFSGVRVGAIGCFRITRDSDLDYDEEEAEDLLQEIERQLKKRPFNGVIRLEAEAKFDPALLRRLVGYLQIGDPDIYRIEGPLDLTFLSELDKLPGFEALHFVPYQPQPVPDLPPENLFAAIRNRDIFLHHPYDSFDSVVELLRQASQDPAVLAIKQTLYRVSGNSPIVRCLADAAQKRKQVLVLVELKARMDEERNISWARELEQAGCHVIYGLVGLKTHSKITLIVRRDDDIIRRYVHLGTGNYNDITARLYTDMGLLTCSESVGNDASAFFNMLSGYSSPVAWHKLVPAPYWLRREFEKRIGLEMAHARAGRPARLIAKVNSLVDPPLIDLLYQASRAGVQIDLIVRGICCLCPGVPGQSDNITVRSIIGRFLEHSRIFYFYNDGQEDLFLSSADWMPRNLDRRVELMFPIEDAAVHEKIMHVLQVELADTVQARLMQPTGEYVRVDRRGKPAVDSQQNLCREAIAAAGGTAAGESYTFTPRTAPPEGS